MTSVFVRLESIVFNSILGWDVYEDGIVICLRTEVDSKPEF